MKKQILHAGLDVDDKAFHFFALVKETGQSFEFKCKPNVSALLKKIEKLDLIGLDLKICYEASYLGFSLYRSLTKKGIDTTVIAPSLIPELTSKKVKTDKIDAQKLALYFSNDLLTAVNIPDENWEADRDLLRTRKFLVEQMIATKNHINGLCRRIDLDFKRETSGKSLWTKTYLIWLEKRIQSLKSSSQRVLLNRLLHTYHNLKSEIQIIEDEVERLTKTETYERQVRALGCYRGLSFISAMTIILELGDIRRFSHPSKLTSYCGLDIIEKTSGGKENKFGITKMGNQHVRRVLVEACQFATKPVRVSHLLRARRKGAEDDMIKIADKCMHRINKKGNALYFRGKERNKIKVACAREMLGFIWHSLNKVSEAAA